MNNPREYYDIYLKRLNRYGENYQNRVQNKREEEFEYYLLKSVYRVEFEYENETHPATFERYKQDETETLHYLLTRVDVNIPNGTVLMLPNKDEVLKPWMVYYLECMKASGYNRYVVLKMTHFLSWEDRNQVKRESWAYMFGQQSGTLRDSLISNKVDSRYTENAAVSHLILPTNEFLKKDNYIEVGEGSLKEAYRVTGYDIQSTPGVEYVTIDPVYIFDNSPAPEKSEADEEEDLFWLNGGIE